MKKFDANNTTMYIFRDHAVAVVEKNGNKYLVPMKMQDVNDSEVKSFPDLAKWIYDVARHAIEIRDENGRVIGISPDTLSKDDLWLASLWLKIPDDQVSESADDAELDPEVAKSLAEYAKKLADRMTPEKRKEFLGQLGIEE